jgi:exosortase D (VPLPA-CTERM-specific)
MILKRYDYSKLSVIALILVSFFWLVYHTGLLQVWILDDEYGHGLLVIAVLSYILYQQRSELYSSSVSYSVFGFVLSIFALFLFFLGEITGILPIRMYSVWFFAIATVFSVGGWALFKKLIVPLGILLLLIPLPSLLVITTELQLISSKLGAWFIRLFGGVVYLEGNVIDMGSIKLLVEEACSGLRYLFPLMSLGAIAAYLMKAPNWMRWSLFLITIPITIFLNSLRIAITGLLVDIYGVKHSEGFLHFFEGWVVFLLALLSLFLFAWLLTYFINDKPNVFDVFRLDAVQNKVKADINHSYTNKKGLIVLVLCFISAMLISTPIFEKANPVIAKKSLSEFPEKLGNWIASESRLPVSIEEVAGANDYYHGFFTKAGAEPVNLYISYYYDQKQDRAPHSPNICLPADGWEIKSDTPYTIKIDSNKSITVSRLVITKGEKMAIAYYWIKQGEYVFYQKIMARLDLLRFALTEGRTDAALIRMLTKVNATETIDEADNRLKEVALKVIKVLKSYVPD